MKQNPHDKAFVPSVCLVGKPPVNERRGLGDEVGAGCPTPF